MKVGTFFSGVGSPEQALKNLIEGGAEIKNQPLEVEIEFACEIDKYARETYLKNFKPKLFATDITTLDMKDLPYVDLLVFGFPCQAFSIAGKRKGFDDTRGTLFYDALRYLREHRPRYFIAENVKGLLSHDKGKTFGTIIDCLAKTTNYQMSLMPFDNLGYHIHYKVLNTKDFGIPQNRERIFIIGIRDDEDNNFNFPKEVPLELKLKDILQDNPNYIIHNLYGGFNEDIRIFKDYCPTLRTPKGGGHIPMVSTNKINKVDEKYYLKEETVKKLEVYNKRNKEKGNGFQAKFHNPETENMSSLKIGGAGADDLIQKSQRIRRLTPIECERLQGFPDNFTAGVSDTQRYKQMGNTITVNVIEAIIKNLIT